MSCFCKIFNKSKQYRPVKSKTNSRSNVGDGNDNTTEHFPQEGSTVSASEVVQLKAEVWSLRHSLSDSAIINNNMQEAITQTVAEKYRLLDELNQTKTEMALAEAQQAEERDKFLQEIDSYRSKINELSCLVEKIAEQNIELKQQLLEANETVCKVARKYMKLKSLES